MTDFDAWDSSLMFDFTLNFLSRVYRTFLLRNIARRDRFGGFSFFFPGSIGVRRIATRIAMSARHCVILGGSSFRKAGMITPILDL